MYTQLSPIKEHLPGLLWVCVYVPSCCKELTNTCDGWIKPHDNSSLTEKALWWRSRDHPKKRSVSLSWLTKCQKGFPFLNRDYNHVRLPAKGTRPDGTSPTLSRLAAPALFLETKMTQTWVNSWEKHPSLCFVKVIKITPWSILLWVTPWTGLFFLARRVTVRQSWTSSQHTSRQHFPSLHFRPCLFLFWQETGDDNIVAQTSRGCLRPAAVPSSCGRLFSLAGLVSKHTKNNTLTV